MKLKKSTYAIFGLILLQFIVITIVVLIMAAHQTSWTYDFDDEPEEIPVYNFEQEF